MPVFELPRDGTSIIALAAGGAIGYEPRPVHYTEATFDGMDQRLASDHPLQRQLLQIARNWRRRAERNPRLMVTFLRERRHTNQFDYLEKVLGAYDPPWFVHRRIEALPRVHLDVVPAATLAVWAFTVIQDSDDIPWASDPLPASGCV